MHVQHPRRPGPLVQIVDILRHDQQLARPVRVEPRQFAMRPVGLDARERRAPRVVEAVHQRRITGERVGRANVLDPVAFPQAVRSAERRQAAFGGDAGAGQDEKRARLVHRVGRAQLSALRG